MWIGTILGERPALVAGLPDYGVNCWPLKLIGRSVAAPFALLFYGPGERLLPQRIYRLEHATLGAFDLFIVPLGPDAQGLRYEAIFTWPAGSTPCGNRPQTRRWAGSPAAGTDSAPG